MRAGGEVPRRLLIAVAAQVARAIHHQAWIAGQLAHHRLIKTLGVRSLPLHCDPRGEGGTPLRAGHRIEAGGIVRLLGEQQRVDPEIVVGRGEAGTEARPQAQLVARAEVSRRPRVARRVEGLGGPPGGGIAVRRPRPAVAAGRLVLGKEGEDGRGILARAHRPFGPGAQRGLFGPAAIGDQEPRIIGEAVAAVLAKPAPVVERVTDARGRGLGERIAVLGSGRGRRILRRARRRGYQQDGQDHNGTPHAGHFAVPLLISQ